MSEMELVNAIIQYITVKGGWAMRVNAGTQVIKVESSTRIFHGAPKGTADIIGLLPGGKFLAIECKFGKNKCSPEQIEYLRRITELGGLAFAAWDIDTTIKILEPYFGGR